jgi:AraC-like DNA-binding protein
MLGRHMIELLCMAIQADDRVLDTHLSSVRAAHLYRAEQYIRANLERSELLPQQVADACGISLRYLQQLFTDTGRSVCDWVREQRLIMCDEELRRPNSRHSISEIAYRWGFADQSQFSKHYRKRFDRTPSETRMQYRDGRTHP